MTHNELVERARAWLFARYPVVISEMASSAGEQPDAIGIDGGRSTVIECKTSAEDLRADRRKPWRRFPDQGMGDERFILAPPFVISPAMIPVGWGLLTVACQRTLTIRKSEKFPKDYRAEMKLLCSALRRVDGRGQGVSVRHYVYQTKNRATIMTEWLAKYEGEKRPAIYKAKGIRAQFKDPELLPLQGEKRGGE